MELKNFLCIAGLVVLVFLFLYMFSEGYESENYDLNYEPSELKNPVTYYFDEINLCDETEQAYIRKAFSMLENATEKSFYFEEVSSFNDSQIVFYCMNYLDGEGGFFTETTLGEAYYDYEDSKHKINLYGFWKYRFEKGYHYKSYGRTVASVDCIYGKSMWKDDTSVNKKCQETLIHYPSFPDVELHEILHLFGFEHVDDPTSIMYHELDSTGLSYYIDEYKIDDWIVERLKNSSNEIKFLGSEYEYSCEEGWHEVEGTEYCCPGPDMTIIDGSCEYK